MSAVANMLGKSASRTKKEYTFDEVLTILVRMKQGKTVKEISEEIGHSSPSVNYKVRWIRAQGEGLFESFGKQPMTEQQITDHVNDLNDQKAG